METSESVLGPLSREESGYARRSVWGGSYHKYYQMYINPSQSSMRIPHHHYSSSISTLNSQH